MELLEDVGFDGLARQVADEALELLGAPNCPTA